MEQIKGVVQPLMKITASTYSCLDKGLADVYIGKYCDHQTSKNNGEKKKAVQMFNPKITQKCWWTQKRQPPRLDRK